MGGVYLIWAGRELGESRGINSSKKGVIRYTAGRVTRDRGD